ncbi:hypothetical protein AWC18_19450 [Mycolicibacter nonchromogenicus]|uniref:Uncharacterized protein n=1 Tax=Mycolicibacter nonchromogenicus TaxID=1782 RepID=A0A1X1YY37_MYCNO|nr:hypothetical protein [Mycolicibacter nonchromogenicus]ORW15891.1 hypothetical protein AWC18_19450 [Mycolicibacter nonchromogenicus]
MTNGTDDLDFDYDDDDDEDEDYGEAEAPRQNKSLKWGLAAVVVLAVVALVLVGVVLLGGDPGKGSLDGSSSSRNAAASGIASADDTGPVSIIINDPSCTAWTSISSNLSSTLSMLGQGKWNERDQSIPASAWDEDQKRQYMAAGQVVRNAAAQTVGLVKLTPHRVMRELYEQFIAYARTFVEHIPTYTARDAALAGTGHSAASALAAICAAAGNGSAAARGPLVEAASAPSKTASPGNPANPQRFLTGPNPVCPDWKATLDKFGADAVEWHSIDPSIPGTYWNPQQKAVNLAVGPIMVSLANKLQQLGRRSNNPTLQDFAELSAQYRRAFVLALPTYDPSDNHLANAATFLSTTVLGACASAATTG